MDSVIREDLSLDAVFKFPDEPLILYTNQNSLYTGESFFFSNTLADPWLWKREPEPCVVEMCSQKFNSDGNYATGLFERSGTKTKPVLDKCWPANDSVIKALGVCVVIGIFGCKKIMRDVADCFKGGRKCQSCVYPLPKSELALFKYGDDEWAADKIEFVNSEFVRNEDNLLRLTFTKPGLWLEELFRSFWETNDPVEKQKLGDVYEKYLTEYYNNFANFPENQARSGSNTRGLRPEFLNANYRWCRYHLLRRYRERGLDRCAASKLAGQELVYCSPLTMTNSYGNFHKVLKKTFLLLTDDERDQIKRELCNLANPEHLVTFDDKDPKFSMTEIISKRIFPECQCFHRFLFNEYNITKDEVGADCSWSACAQDKTEIKYLKEKKIIDQECKIVKCTVNWSFSQNKTVQLEHIQNNASCQTSESTGNEPTLQNWKLEFANDLKQCSLSECEPSLSKGCFANQKDCVDFAQNAGFASDNCSELVDCGKLDNKNCFSTSVSCEEFHDSTIQYQHLEGNGCRLVTASCDPDPDKNCFNNHLECIQYSEPEKFGYKCTTTGCDPVCSDPTSALCKGCEENSKDCYLDLFSCTKNCEAATANASSEGNGFPVYWYPIIAVAAAGALAAVIYGLLKKRRSAPKKNSEVVLPA